MPRKMMSKRKRALDYFLSNDRLLRLFAPWAWQTINLIQHSGVRQNRPRQNARVFDLVYLLHRHRPRHISEMGSGLSTIVFARYCARSRAHLTSYEDDPAWVDLVDRAARAAGISGFRPLLVDRFDEDDECGYKVSVHPDTDFLYIDGPSNMDKRVCADALRALNAGCQPRLIVIDGRFQTVRALMRSRFDTDYDWHVSEKSALQIDGALKTRIGRHTLAIRR
jgi:hypothetical protein